jgi:hypothetical protein
MRRSFSVSTLRCWRPATTRSSAQSKSDWLIVRSLRLRELSARQPRGLPRDGSQIDVVDVERLAAGVDPEDGLATGEVGRRHEQLTVEPAGAQQRRVEVLDPVGGAHHDDLLRALEAVELDEQLVEGLVLLTVEAVSRALRADGVELVDEDDRRRVLPRLVEELADARRTEAGEHLHERRGGGAVEVRA